jgi:hypothetical protein
MDAVARTVEYGKDRWRFPFHHEFCANAIARRFYQRTLKDSDATWWRLSPATNRLALPVNGKRNEG